MEAWDSTPRIAFLSPEPGSGKTQGARGNASFWFPTLSKRSTSHRLTSFAKLLTRLVRQHCYLMRLIRCLVRVRRTTKRLGGCSTQAIARVPLLVAVLCAAKRSSPRSYRHIARWLWQGLGYLPDTIFTRSVIVKMRRRAPNETVEPYRRRLEVMKGEALRNRLGVWATSITEQIHDKWPVMPEGITDRNADVWEALLSIADAAGGKWPEQGTCRGCHPCRASSVRGEGSLGYSVAYRHSRHLW